MLGAILGIHILVCAALVVIVLLQSGKGGGLAGAFGGAGGVGAVFGGQAAATFLTKATRYLAIGFMVTSLGMAFAVRASTGGGTVSGALESRQPAAATTAGETVPAEGVPGELQESTDQAMPEGGEAEGAPTEQVPVVPEGE